VIDTSGTVQPGHTTASVRVLSRRRVLAAGAGALVGSAAQVGALQAQSDAPPSPGHNPFSHAVATPDSTVAGPESLVALLSYVPQAMLDRLDGSGVHWYYADLAQQFDAVGVTRTGEGPDGKNEAWLPALMTLATASNAFQVARLPEFTDAVGFKPLAVDQTLLVGDPPAQLTLFRGGFDAARLEAAWEGAGYTFMSTPDGTSFWSIGTEGEVEIDHPVQRLVFANFNNLTLVGDTLLCAPTRELLEAALATSAGETPSAAAHPVFGASLHTLPEKTVSAMALGAAAVGISSNADPGGAGSLNDLIAQSNAEVGPMPPYDGLLTAVAAGAVTTEDGGAAGTAMIRIVAGSAEDAEQVTNVVEYRWNEGRPLLTSQPYTDLMTITGLSVVDSVAMIDFDLVRSSRVWSDLFLSRDTAPFVQ